MNTTMINHQPLPAKRKTLKDVAAGASARLKQPVAPAYDADYPVGAKVLILDCENEGHEGHVAYVVQPGASKSTVEWYSPEGDRHTAVVSHRSLGLMDGPSKRFLNAAKLPERDPRRQTLLEQERAARIQDARRAEGFGSTAFAPGAMVRYDGIMGALGKVGFVEHVDGKEAIVRYYDSTGKPDRQMVRQPIEKLEVLQEPSWRMKAMGQLPANSPKRADLEARESEYRQAAARKGADLPKGEKFAGIIQEIRQGVDAASKDAVQGLNIEPGR